MNLPEKKFLHCIYDQITLLSQKLQAYLFHVIESTLKGLSSATKLTTVALAVQKWQHFQDDGSFLQQKRLAEKNENFSRI